MKECASNARSFFSSTPLSAILVFRKLLHADSRSHGTGEAIAVNMKAGVIVRMNLTKLPGILPNDLSANMDERKSDHAIAKCIHRPPYLQVARSYEAILQMHAQLVVNALYNVDAVVMIGAALIILTLPFSHSLSSLMLR
jgi:hypothetical protein